ncbi:hypothetical protein V5O48_006804 [Marasmius crinis-equi]|uniref:Uncharacterized protein n=1 Tax=Marasmius crinis-equi TaxID=585013 RepID=A0ABR3FII5_9AGAR
MYYLDQYIRSSNPPKSAGYFIMSLRLALARSRKPVSRVKPTKTGRWSEDEDQRLREGIKYHGDDWESIASKMVRTRTASQCSGRWARVWSPEEDMGLRRGFNDHGAKWPLISRLYVPSRTTEECRKRWKLLSSRRHDDPSSPNAQPEPTVNCVAPTPKVKSRDGGLKSTELSPSTRCPCDQTDNLEDPSSTVTEERLTCNEVDTILLESFGFTSPPPIETQTAFRKREAENLVKIARKLSELDGSWASTKQSLVDQIEKHARMFEEGFSQVEGIQQSLQLIPRQPISADPQEKLECLSADIQASQSRIRALEESLSRLEKQKQESSQPTTSPSHTSYSGTFASNVCTSGPSNAHKSPPSLSLRAWRLFKFSL